jgi:hypothetical protein
MLRPAYSSRPVAARQFAAVFVLLIGLTFGAACDRHPGPPATPSSLERDRLQVLAVSPAVALTDTSTEVLISGRGFAQGVTVMFGDEPGQVVWVTAASLAVRTPSRGPGEAVIALTHPDGTRVTHHAPFRFMDVGFARVSPDSGIPTMFTTLSVGYFPPGARVTFGGLDAQVTISATGVIFARVPDNGAAAGPVDVALIRPDGRVHTLAGAFTYVPVALTPSTLSIAAGARMTLSWANPVDWYNDFFSDGVGLYRIGDQNALPVWRDDVWSATGTVSLPAPIEPGAYEFRFFVANQRVLAGVSPTLIVTPAPDGLR